MSVVAGRYCTLAADCCWVLAVQKVVCNLCLIFNARLEPKKSVFILCWGGSGTMYRVWLVYTP